MHTIKKSIIGVLGVIGIVAATHASGIITIPSTMSNVIPNFTNKINAVHFNRGGNNFQGLIIRNGTQTLNTPQTVTYGSTTLSCNKRVSGVYYNNQRGARRWPLDNTTHTALINTDPSYSSLGVDINGGLFTDCGGNSNAVYGQITHTRSGTTYKLAAGLIYDFANNTYQASGTANSLIFNNNQGSGYIYDSAGGIGILSGTAIQTGNGGNGGGGGGNSGGGGGGGGGGGFISSTTTSGSSSSGSRLTGTIAGATTKLCHYADIDYAGKGPFSDTLGHRGFDYIEILRISCLNQGRGVKKGLWTYEPNANITRAEVLKTVSKILGSSFQNLQITNESNIYTGNKPFADTPNWFNHYADYAFKQGLTEGLYTVKDAKMHLDPDKAITRYEAIKIMMLAYNKISQSLANTAGPSVMGDIIDVNNPYYSYVRQAEVLGFISGVPKANGGYNFEGNRNLTRAEFAKIIGLPFADQLFEIEQIIYQSDLYKDTIDALNTTTTNKAVFIQALYEQITTLNETTFIKKYKVPKQLFLETLYETVVAPILGAYTGPANNQQ